MRPRIREGVRNPLAIIALFATLSEASMSYVLVKLPVEIQWFFVWFVMLFPVLLSGGFFFFLHKKPAVFFSPSDYTSDKTYLDSIMDTSKYSDIDLRIKQLEQTVDTTEDFIGKIVSDDKDKGVDLEKEFGEKRRRLDLLHEVEKNNLYSFLNSEIEIGETSILKLVAETKSVRELPQMTDELLGDKWKSQRISDAINKYPQMAADYELLKKIIEKGSEND